MEWSWQRARLTVNALSPLHRTVHLRAIKLASFLRMPDARRSVFLGSSQTVNSHSHPILDTRSRSRQHKMGDDGTRPPPSEQATLSWFIRTSDDVRVEANLLDLKAHSKTVSNMLEGVDLRAMSASVPDAEREFSLGVDSRSLNVVLAFVDHYRPDADGVFPPMPPNNEDDILKFQPTAWDLELLAPLSIVDLFRLASATDLLEIATLHWWTIRTAGEKVEALDSIAEIRRQTGQPESAALPPEEEKTLLECLGWMTKVH